MTPKETDLNICPNCEEEIAADEVCPECGWNGMYQKTYLLEPLEIGVVLQDRYEVIEKLSAEETSNSIEFWVDGINCYLMMDKESQSSVVVKEVAIPTVSEKSTKWEEELKSDSDVECLPAGTDFASKIRIEDDSEVCFEEYIEESVEEATESPIESNDEDVTSVSDSQKSDLLENKEFTNESSMPAIDSDDQPILNPVPKSPFERLQEERSILGELEYPTIVKIVDYFEDNERAYLVEEHFESRTLWEAWHLPETSMTQKIDWLIQLCQALAKVHAANILYNAVTPYRLRVSTKNRNANPSMSKANAENQQMRPLEEGVGRSQFEAENKTTSLVNKLNRLVLTDFSAAVKLPLEEKHQQGVDFYAAPELVLNPETVDVRADLYSLGVMWYELLLDRHLTDEDFECQFILKPLQDYLPNLNPIINRLLLKLTNHNPDLRFSSDTEVKDGKQPVASLQRNLLQLKQSLTQSTLVVGSQTNIGIQREANEDNLWAQNLSYRSADGDVPLGLFIVADGMGGAEAGEVASKIAIQTTSNILLPKLIPLREKVQADHSADLLPEIESAIINANKEVIAQTEQIPLWRGMGSTLTLAAIVGMRAYVGHVGDSRLYLINKDGIQQKTKDHSIVSRLLQIGAITPAEAETHPQREVLVKAVGAKSRIEPDTFSFTTEPGDILLLCSDGLTKYQEDSEIYKIVMDASSLQQACNSLVNHTNLCGGEDNITVIAVKIVDTTD